MVKHFDVAINILAFPTLTLPLVHACFCSSSFNPEHAGQTTCTCFKVGNMFAGQFLHQFQFDIMAMRDLNSAMHSN